MKKTNIFKIAALTAVFAVAGMFANAQITDPSSTDLNQQTPVNGSVVKVIDNKGTVKYLQSANGITTITSTVSGNQTTTTFQLGGTLLEDTYIDVDGNEFGITGLDFVTSPPTAATAPTGAGFAMMVIDNVTGDLKKMYFTDLIQAGQELFVATDGLVSYPLTAPGVVLPTFQKVYVYRNGAKLIAGVDYSVATNVVTLIPTNANENFTIYAGDRIEVHFIK